jgi:hypothetical protein
MRRGGVPWESGKKETWRMDKVSLVISVGSLLTAVAAALFARYQLVAARQANSMPVFLQLAQEFRQQDFWEHERYILDELNKECSPEKGYSSLPAHAKYHFHVIVSFYSSFGLLVRFGLTSVELASASFGYRMEQAWHAMKPFVLKERERPFRSQYAGFFEDLVYRTGGGKGQDEMMEKLGLMPRSESGSPTRSE